MPLKIVWWFTHITPIVRKLAPYVASCGHWPRSLESSFPDCAPGSTNCSTSKVMATAKTPSLKASNREVLLAIER